MITGRLPEKSVKDLVGSSGIPKIICLSEYDQLLNIFYN
jgi:hypothetical protein